MHHEQLDIVTLLTHDLYKSRHTVKSKAVDTPEVLHKLVVVYAGIRYKQGEYYYCHKTEDATGAHGLVAEV